jgi:hypothetical protein
VSVEIGVIGLLGLEFVVDAVVADVMVTPGGGDEAEPQAGDDARCDDDADVDPEAPIVDAGVAAGHDAPPIQRAYMSVPGKATLYDPPADADENVPG